MLYSCIHMATVGVKGLTDGHGLHAAELYLPRLCRYADRQVDRYLFDPAIIAAVRGG